MALGTPCPPLYSLWVPAVSSVVHHLCYLSFSLMLLPIFSLSFTSPIPEVESQSFLPPPPRLLQGFWWPLWCGEGQGGQSSSGVRLQEPGGEAWLSERWAWEASCSSRVRTGAWDYPCWGHVVLYLVLATCCMCGGMLRELLRVRCWLCWDADCRCSVSRRREGYWCIRQWRALALLPVCRHLSPSPGQEKLLASVRTACAHSSTTTLFPSILCSPPFHGLDPHDWRLFCGLWWEVWGPEGSTGQECSWLGPSGGSTTPCIPNRYTNAARGGSIISLKHM